MLRVRLHPEAQSQEKMDNTWSTHRTLQFQENFDIIDAVPREFPKDFKKIYISSYKSNFLPLLIVFYHIASKIKNPKKCQKFVNRLSLIDNSRKEWWVSFVSEIKKMMI